MEHISEEIQQRLFAGVTRYCTMKERALALKKEMEELRNECVPVETEILKIMADVGMKSCQVSDTDMSVKVAHREQNPALTEERFKCAFTSLGLEEDQFKAVWERVCDVRASEKKHKNVLVPRTAHLVEYERTKKKLKKQQSEANGHLE